MAAARLRIHAEDRIDRFDSFFRSALHRLRARYARGARSQTRIPLGLRVEALDGQRLRVIDDAGPLTDVPLPAGTYQVTVIRGGLTRGYTMTLEPGVSFDLFVRLVPDRP